MKIINDFLLADIAYLTSDRYLLPGNSKVSELRTMCDIVANYQPYIQRNLRNEDIEYLLRVAGYVDDADHLIVTVSKVLSRLARTFLEWQGHCFVVKPAKLELWLELLSMVDAAWIIAQAYLDLHHQYLFSKGDVADCIVNNQCTLALESPKFKHEFADNHVHLGGHGHTSPSLLSFALYGQDTGGISWPKRPENTLFESGRLHKHELARQLFAMGQKLINCGFDTSETGLLDLQQVAHSENVVLNQRYRLQVETASDLATHCFIRADDINVKSDNRWILFCLSVLGVDTKNKSERHILQERFVRAANIMRNYMIVSGTGLGQFAESFGFSARKMRDSEHQKAVADDGLSTDIDGSTMREFRISPAFLADKKAALNTKRLEKALMLALRNSLVENMHFVVHFSRTYSSIPKASRNDNFHELTRLKLREYVAAIQALKSSVTLSDLELNDVNSPDFPEDSTSVDLRKTIRGFDVAGNENHLPVEVFAPTLRVLRSGKHATKDLFTSRFSRPFLTIHAGEDYSHLLSGLRAIDEAVYFCDFKAGDRLGHALALGIEPRVWAARQKNAYLTVEEHLDNLVWCYQKALDVVQKAPQFAGVLQLLKDKIRYWSLIVYHDDEQVPDCRDLYEAWKLRRNCPLVAQMNPENALTPSALAGDPFQDEWLMDQVYDSDHHQQKIAIKLWRKYLLANLNQNSVSNNRNIPLIVHCEPKSEFEPFGYIENQYYDSVSVAELDLYEAIQDQQMEKYSTQQIILEACPTSNIYIGRFEHYHEHPIFRWDPPDPDLLNSGCKYNRFGLRKGKVITCVNTDDAALMPTTIQNEHRVLQYEAVNHFGVGALTAEDWINRIREKGVEVFKTNHLDWLNKRWNCKKHCVIE